MATRNQIKACGFERLKNGIEAMAADGGPKLFAGILEDVERSLKDAEPDRGDERVNYFRECENIAREILDEYPKDDDWADKVHVAVDGNHWVIYYFEVRKVLDFSDNAEYGLSEGIVEMRNHDDFDGLCAELAFWAMREDVMEKLHDLKEERDREIEDMIDDAKLNYDATAFVVVDADGRVGTDTYSLDVDGYLDAVEVAKPGRTTPGREVWTAREADSDHEAEADEDWTLGAKVWPESKGG